jgi:multimeric flavodoxin WrbA
MFVLGLQGSPRRKGNTAYLLDLFLAEARRRGARTEVVSPAREAIVACKGCGACEKTGICVSDDVMAKRIFSLLRQADVVVTASPVYFYGVTAQLKGLIDRCQTLWSRKYRLKLTDPGASVRCGVMLAVGATRGAKLFDGLHLTVDYFFDAIAARSAGSLTYRGIEHAGDMARRTADHDEVVRLAGQLCQPLAARRAVAFLDDGPTGGGRMAAAWMRHLAGASWDVYATDPSLPGPVAAIVERTLAVRGIDFGYAGIQPLSSATSPMDQVVAVGSAVPDSPRATAQWPLETVSNDIDPAFYDARCDDIRERVRRLIDGTGTTV